VRKYVAMQWCLNNDVVVARKKSQAAQGEQLLIGGVGDWRGCSGFRHWNFRRLKLLRAMYRELIARLTAF
jgi:hypothetical protein